MYIGDIMNSKGFTLVELLAVLIILSVIMGIAIPTITSSMERTKSKQNDQKYRMLESYAEIYVTDHKNEVYRSSSTCCINFDMLSEYLPDDALLDANGKTINGYILFTRPTSSSSAKYEFKTGSCSVKSCDE